MLLVSIIQGLPISPSQDVRAGAVDSGAIQIKDKPNKSYSPYFFFFLPGSFNSGMSIGCLVGYVEKSVLS